MFCSVSLCLFLFGVVSVLFVCAFVVVRFCFLLFVIVCVCLFVFDFVWLCLLLFVFGCVFGCV